MSRSAPPEAQLDIGRAASHLDAANLLQKFISAIFPIGRFIYSKCAPLQQAVMFV
jgi:hypothetical protein